LWWDGSGGRERCYYFITDGGHHDNLGLEALLRRRCRLIIVADATADRQYGFADLIRVLRRERRERGIRLRPLSREGRTDGEALDLNRVHPKALRPDFGKQHGKIKDDAWLSRAHYFAAHIDYPAAGPHSPGETGLLIYVKPSLDGDEATDLLAHWSAHAEFPHDPTTNQFFDENKVESYRQLGEHIGERVCQDLLASKGEADPWMESSHGAILQWADQLRQRSTWGGVEPPATFAAPPVGTPRPVPATAGDN